MAQGFGPQSFLCGKLKNVTEWLIPNEPIHGAPIKYVMLPHSSSEKSAKKLFLPSIWIKKIFFEQHIYIYPV